MCAYWVRVLRCVSVFAVCLCSVIVCLLFLFVLVCVICMYLLYNYFSVYKCLLVCGCV